MRYRIYIDETGCSQARAPKKEKSRYFSLTGVIVPIDAMKRIIEPNFNHLRAKHFGHTAESPVILHRREMVKFDGPFQCLKNKKPRVAWEEDFLTFLTQTTFTVITVCIDKAEFYRRWPDWPEDPYHLCISNMMERYVHFLRWNRAYGEVVAEARNKIDDSRLAVAYSKWHANGDRYISSASIQRHVVPQITIFPRRENVIGLQVSDLLAMPSFYVCQYFSTKKDEFRSELVRKIGRILERQKYHRTSSGRKDGFGRIWRPKYYSNK